MKTCSAKTSLVNSLGQLLLGDELHINSSQQYINRKVNVS